MKDLLYTLAAIVIGIAAVLLLSMVAKEGLKQLFNVVF